MTFTDVFARKQLKTAVAWQNALGAGRPRPKLCRRWSCGTWTLEPCSQKAYTRCRPLAHRHLVIGYRDAHGNEGVTRIWGLKDKDTQIWRVVGLVTPA